MTEDIGLRMPLVDFLTLTDEDFASLEEIEYDLLHLAIEEHLVFLRHPENSSTQKLQLALAIARMSQVLACKHFGDATKPNGIELGEIIHVSRI